MRLLSLSVELLTGLSDGSTRTSDSFSADCRHADSFLELHTDDWHIGGQYML